MREQTEIYYHRAHREHRVGKKKTSTSVTGRGLTKRRRVEEIGKRGVGKAELRRQKAELGNGRGIGRGWEGYMRMGKGRGISTTDGTGWERMGIGDAKI